MLSTRAQKAVGRLAEAVDHWLAPGYLALRGEAPSLISILFHGVSLSEQDIDPRIVDPGPQQGITVDRFRNFIDYYLGVGYDFVTPGDILAGLDPAERGILITFDDGYANNQNALAVLREYDVPALFCISANHVANGQCFWWDVLYRERTRQGIVAAKIEREKAHLKSKRHGEIGRHLIAEFGAAALRPLGDMDRPFRPSELRDFVAHPLVHLGNHTADHAILTNYGAKEVADQIRFAQEALTRMTGVSPETISYPNGGYSNAIVEIAGAEGIRLGITLDFKKNYLPIAEPLKLGRFILRGENSIRRQCRAFRSDLSLYRKLRSFSIPSTVS